MTQPFRQHTGIAAALLQANIDTDAIIPSREMKLVSKVGLAEGLFANWRYLEPGSRYPNPAFLLNQPAYAGTTILLGGENFGCGSSREHAVWALAEYGIKAILAPSFGAIFHKNCIGNGILPATAESSVIEALAAYTKGDPQNRPIKLDLESKTVACGEIGAVFSVPDADRDKLLLGLDGIAFTLSQSDAIDEFEARHHEARPWLVIRKPI